MRLFIVVVLSISFVLASVLNFPLTNKALYYTASIGIGSPETNYELIVNTAGGNIWIGANKTYVKTSTSQDTGNSMSVDESSGQEYTDTVTIGSSAIINKQSIGVASNVKAKIIVDGMIGLGPVDLTRGTVINTDTVPTVIDNLFSQGTISENMFSISFEPITDSSGEQLNGELTVGGTDSSKYTGAITYAPITITSPATQYWGIDALISYGDTTILSTTAGIVDSSSSFISIAKDAFNKYQKATGGVVDGATGLLSITSDQFANLNSLYFNINGVAFELTPNAQIFPRALNSQIGGVAGGIYLIITDNGSNSGSGLDFTLGKPFLERFYTVFDTANQRVGVANTPFTTATTN
jgi:hypothetical protein